jgi:hypothetical protein
VIAVIVAHGRPNENPDFRRREIFSISATVLCPAASYWLTAVIFNTEDEANEKFCKNFMHNACLYAVVCLWESHGGVAKHCGIGRIGGGICYFVRLYAFK